MREHTGLADNQTLRAAASSRLQAGNISAGFRETYLPKRTLYSRIFPPCYRADKLGSRGRSVLSRFSRK